MPLRRILLRTMLWSLAIAAVIGATSILIGPSSLMWRVVGTTVLTAVAAAVLMAASILVDRPNGRRAGLFAMFATLAASLLALAMIWDLAVPWLVYRSEDFLGLTMISLIATSIPATAFLCWEHRPHLRIGARVGLFLDAIVFGLLMIAIWVSVGLLRAASSVWFEMAMACAYLGTLIVLCLFGINEPRDTVSKRGVFILRCLGIVAAAVSLAMALVGIWKELHQSNFAYVVITTVAIIAAHASMCYLAPLTPPQQWIRLATVGASIVAGFSFDLSYWLTSGYSDEMSMRLGQAAAFVASCGSLAVVILARINLKAYVAPRTYHAATHIGLTCPGCSKKHTLPVGDSQCPNCRLSFEIRIREPRCPNCDYMLFMLTSDRCPECGTVIGGGSIATGSPPGVTA